MQWSLSIYSKKLKAETFISPGKHLLISLIKVLSVYNTIYLSSVALDTICVVFY